MLSGKPDAPIAFLLSSLHAGGGERVMLDLANAFAAEGRPVQIVLLKDGGEYASEIDPRVRVITFGASRMIFSLPKLMSYLRRERPRAVMATDEYTHLLALAARYLARMPTRVVLRIGNMFSVLYARQQGLKRRCTYALIRRWYRYADYVIANSEGVAADISAVAGLDAARLGVIYNPKSLTGLRQAAQEPAGHTWLDAKTLPVVCTHGRLRAQKNLPLLIRAFARVTETVPARLLIVGGGREEEPLKALIHELKLDERVALVGYRANPYAFLAKADLFVSASLWEGMPNSLMEALALGVPVIAADCPSGPRELLAPQTRYDERLRAGSEDAEFGLLAAVGDEDALASSMQRLLEDDSLRAEYARKGLARAETFAFPMILPQYARALGL